MKPTKSTLLWILVAAVLIPVGVGRIRLAMLTPEEHVEKTITELLETLEDRQPKRISDGLSDDFEDATTGYVRRDVVDAAKFVLVPGNRFRATLAEEDGLVFTERTDETITVDVRCNIEQVLPDGTAVPWWEFEATLDLVRESGRWVVIRSRNVNHGKRPRR